MLSCVAFYKSPIAAAVLFICAFLKLFVYLRQIYPCRRFKLPTCIIFTKPDTDFERFTRDVILVEQENKLFARSFNFAYIARPQPVRERTQILESRRCVIFTLALSPDLPATDPRIERVIVRGDITALEASELVRNGSIRPDLELSPR